MLTFFNQKYRNFLKERYADVANIEQFNIKIEDILLTCLISKKWLQATCTTSDDHQFGYRCVGDKEELQNRILRASRTALITSIQTTTPLNTYDVVRYAVHCLKMDVTETMDILQLLYKLNFISYPRTKSQNFPDNFNFREILNSMDKYGKYGNAILELSSRESLKYNKGAKPYNCHPAIHHLGKVNKNFKTFNESHRKILDFITEHTLGAFNANVTRPVIMEMTIEDITFTGYICNTAVKNGN